MNYYKVDNSSTPHTHKYYVKSLMVIGSCSYTLEVASPILVGDIKKCILVPLGQLVGVVAAVALHACPTGGVAAAGVILTRSAPESSQRRK